MLGFKQHVAGYTEIALLIVRQVVLTQATHLYFDHPFEPDPEERGYYWAPRFIDTRKTFGFMPDDVYANADFTRMGEPIVDLCKEMYKGKCVPLKKPQNIAGIHSSAMIDLTLISLQQWSTKQRKGSVIRKISAVNLLCKL